MAVRALCCAFCVILLCILRVATQSECPRSCTCFNTSSEAVVWCVKANLRTVPPDIPADTTILSLSYNRIARLDSDSFAGLSMVHKLYIRSNEITEIQPYAFRGLTALRVLALNSNQISQLYECSFCGLQEMTRLNLNRNALQEIPENTFKPLTSLKELLVSQNRIQCNCNNAWMKDFLPLHAPRARPVVCVGPSGLQGKHIDDIPLAALNCTPPTITAPAAAVEGFRGEPVFLQCEVAGSPPPSVHWVHSEQLGDSELYHVFSNGTLLIVSMSEELSGDYLCVAGNFLGNSSATVRVEYSGIRVPVLLQAPANTHVFVGESFTLQCSGDEYTLRYQWLKDGVELVTSERVLPQVGEGLRVQNASTEDAGNYTCVASSREGETRGSAAVDVTGPVLTCEGVISAETVAEVREQVDLAFRESEQELLVGPASPSLLLRLLNLPPPGAVELARAAEVFQEALERVRAERIPVDVDRGSVIPKLTPCELTVLAELSGCTDHRRTVDCSQSCHLQRYRSHDGTCNNLNRPLQGSADTPLLRLLDPAYEDGLGLPVGWSSNLSLPSARLISSKLIRTHTVTPSESHTLMLMQFGQFLDHDMDQSPIGPSDIVFRSGASCTSVCTNEAPCFPIPVPEGDPRITERQCIPFTRSSGVCGTGGASLLVGAAAVRREQLNAITAYMDASQVYGSDNYTAHRLRDPSGGGRLVEGLPSAGGKHFLPFDNHSLVECSTGIHSNRSNCFLAGDARTNEQVGLTSMHTLLFREHNRLAAALAALNPLWGDELLYQEARRILVAEWQHIAISEYLPKILGPAGMAMLGAYSGYDPDVDASIANAFSTAAFRFGHSQIMPLFPRLGPDYKPLPIGPLKLQDAFFAPFRLLEEQGIEPLIRGLLASPVKLRRSSQGLNTNLTEALFAQANSIALDLASLNIQRGRDHGLPSYSQWRAYCGLRTAHIISELSGEISNATVRALLREVYGDDPGKIDLWVGGLLEDVVPGSQLGPTFLCLIADQFRRLRDGDRFWYEREGQFSPDQLLQLQQASLSRLICDNAHNISRVPRDSFVLQPVQHFVPCASLPSVELGLWRDCSTSCEVEGRGRRSAVMDSVWPEDLLVRVARLEEQAGMCRFNDDVYPHGSSWGFGSCTTCTCKVGAVVCHDCTDPSHQDG